MHLVKMDDESYSYYCVERCPIYYLGSFLLLTY
jgi:hypothetical protein